jgi:Ca-activated chloride channel family protein
MRPVRTPRASLATQRRASTAAAVGLAGLALGAGLLTSPGCASGEKGLRVDRDGPAPWAPAAPETHEEAVYPAPDQRARRGERFEEERLADAGARPWAPQPAPLARRPQPDRERDDDELGPRERRREPEPAAPAGFVDAAEDARSTFGVDIDTASYTLIRNHLARGLLPPAGAVRVEEVVNALDAGLQGPAGDAGFAVHLEGAPSPFGPPGSWLVRLGLRARDVSQAERRPATLVLCLDTSGSMGEEGKLALVQASLRRLVRALRPDDEVAIVTFDTDAEVALEPTSVDDEEDIEDAIDDLRPDGATNVDAGLKLAYDVALAARWPRGARGACEETSERIVRVVLCTDGIANTGRTQADAILARVRGHVAEGITLTAIGVGISGYGDALLERLADSGDGHYRYVDGLEEARRVFVEDLTGTLEVVARDAKLQVTVDPAAVRGWRLLGYEDRRLNDRDFRDDRKDGGEVGPGHTTTALYELVLRDDVEESATSPFGLGAATTLLSARIRWQDPRDGAPREAGGRLRRRDLVERVDDLSPRFLLQAVGAELAEVLRRSPRATSSPRQLLTWAEVASDRLPGDRQAAELLQLVDQAVELARSK